jgi:hypothetical protein
MHTIRWASLALLALGCAGTLEEDPRPPGSGGGGSGPPVDMCVVNTTALRSCQAAGCHTGTPLSAGLDLSAASVTTNAKSFLDKANVGTMGVTMPGDPLGCEPGKYKLVDSANVMNSLLLTKSAASGETPMPPCGSKMPVIGTFTANDKACLASWVNSVIALK